MSVKNFIPTIWDDKIFQSYDEQLVLAGLSNRSYEGQISAFGDRVKISEIGDMSTADYTGSTITYAEADDASKYLVIDQKKVVAITLDDVDAAQTKPKLMAEITRKMGVAIAEGIESYISGLYTDAGIIVSGTTGSATSVTSANVSSIVRSAATKLDEKSVPQANRVAVVPPWFHAKMDLAKVIRDTDNTPILNRGYVGEYFGFQIYKSNLISHSGTSWYAPMFFTAGDSIAFAEQMMMTEVLRDKDTMKDYMRALAVYGAKVVRPDALAVAYVSEGSESAI